LNYRAMEIERRGETNLRLLLLCNLSSFPPLFILPPCHEYLFITHVFIYAHICYLTGRVLRDADHLHHGLAQGRLQQFCQQALRKRRGKRKEGGEGGEGGTGIYLGVCMGRRGREEDGGGKLEKTIHE